MGRGASAPAAPSAQPVTSSRPRSPQRARGNFRAGHGPAKPVSIDSGWNCTPSMGSVLWRSPMTIPSVVQAGHLEAVGNRVGVDDERVVPRGLEHLGQVLEHAAPVVVDRRRLAVHDLGRAHDPPAEDLADALVAEADAEDRQALTSQFGDRGRAHARVLGQARTGRHHQRGWHSSALRPATSTASLRTTTGSAPSSPRYCTRL